MATKKRQTKIPKKQSKLFKDTGNKTSASKKEKIKKILKNVLCWLILFIVSLIAVDYVVQYINYHASVAVVNGERISRNEFYDKLEASYGSSIASTMINQILIYQAGEDEEVDIPDEAIESEIKVLEDNYDSYYGGSYTLDDALEEQGMTKDDLKQQVEMTLIVKEILGPGISITEEEAQAYFDENKDTLYEEDTVYEDVKDEIFSALEEEELDATATDWLAALQEEANIQNNIDDPRDYSFLGITRDFFSKLFEKDSSSEE